MKNIDIEHFYRKINKQIEATAAYVQDPLLPKIIKHCRLKPVSAFMNGFQYQIKVEHKWIDEFGNSLNVDVNHDEIILGDLSIESIKVINTDLFYGRSIKNTILDSKFIFTVDGFDPKSENKISLVFLYGIDEYIRSFIIKNVEYYQISPLLLGSKALHLFLNNLGRNILIEDNIYPEIPLKIEKCVIATLPLRKEIVEIEWLKTIY